MMVSFNESGGSFLNPSNLVLCSEQRGTAFSGTSKLIYEIIWRYFPEYVIRYPIECITYLVKTVSTIGRSGRAVKILSHFFRGRVQFS
jgi:hypothetical protein